MPRQIAPGNPPAIDVNLTDVKLPDFKELDALGDAKIKAANQNFELYADTLLKTESAKLYEQYKNDPIQLANALGKLPGMLKGLPEEMQDKMNSKLYLTGIGLVQKAQNNQLVLQDQETARNAQTNIEASKELMAQEYQNILQNHISNAEDKDLVANDIFLAQQMNLNNLADTVNHKGKNIYTEAQRKKIRDVDNLELEGFKQFFDTMLMNDNDDLQQSKDYYTKFILAPERFMAENYMNRATYDKAKAYAEKELKRAGADIKKAKFNQSVKEYTSLQLQDMPGTVESLRESDLLSKDMINQMEKVNVKFNEIDPSKTESPVALINTLQLLKELSFKKPTTEAEQQEILEAGTRALDMIADLGKEYGLSEKTMDIARRNVVLLETDAAWAPVLDNFNAIIDNFDRNLARTRAAQTKSSGAGKWYALTRWDGMSNEESRKYMELNNLLANSMVQMHNALRVGDNETLRKIQRETQVEAAKMLYDWVDWEEAAKNKDYVCPKNGLFVCPVNINKNGSVDFKIVK